MGQEINIADLLRCFCLLVLTIHQLSSTLQHHSLPTKYIAKEKYLDVLEVSKKLGSVFFPNVSLL